MPMATNVVRTVKWLTYFKWLPSKKFITRDKQKPFYLHCYSAYDHQTWQDGDLPWRAPTVIVIRPFNHVLLLDYVTN